ncbi:uncharacterized protein LOC135078710 [Ostrinia nubilalis]|uniref:uncharacterized protein LOC135078710 n=1 Tax=Ostrinia nubilalis TaxID=29057 RepID=UPI0030823799
MFRTPPRCTSTTMVKTRSARNNECPNNGTNIGEQGDEQGKENVIEPGTSGVKEENVKPSTLQKSSVKSSHKSKSKMASSAIKAQQKKLELEAAKEMARIQMELVQKKLEADLAAVEEQYSSCSSRCDESESRYDGSNVKEWMERSQRELERQKANNDGNNKGYLFPPPPVTDGTEGPIQQLTSALKALVATSAPTKSHDTNLLSRLSTPGELPLFSGDYMEWLSFKNAYEESTAVCNFSDRENLWRLRKCLRGPAKEAVTALLISTTSPAIVMSTLELQFGNPDLIVTRILQDVKKLSPLPQEYHRDIVSFSIKVKNFVVSVQELKREEYLHGIEVVNLILAKLPTVLLSKWVDYSYPLISERKKPRLNILSDFLNTEAVKTSTCSANLMNIRCDYKRKLYGDQGCERTQTVLVQSDNERSDTCRFCRGSKHDLTDCRKFKKSLRKDRWFFVRRSGLCYKCLISRHERQTCPATVCDVAGCGQPHHRLLHYTPSARPHDAAPARAGGDAPPAAETETSAQSEAVTHINTNNCSVLLKVVPVNIHGPNGVFKACALLDDGSTVSIMSSALAERAGIRGRKQSMRVRGAWDNTELVCETELLDLTLSNKHGEKFDLQVRSVDELNLPKQDLSIVHCGNYGHLLELESELCCASLKPEVLIGQDNYHLLVPLDVVAGGPAEPCATRTPLGWCVHGRVPRALSARAPHATLFITDAAVHTDDNSLRELHDDVHNFFSIESMGVSAAKPRQNAEDLRAWNRLEETATLIDGRWHVGLPWKDKDCVLTDSLPLAMARLKHVELKMRRSREYAERYHERLQHLLQNDYAKELETDKTLNKTWYLPHFGVDNPNKKKLRLVYDAAAKTGGLSLNDYLLKGPDLLMSLFGIMLRFRENKIAVTADIKDMFLRVKIRPEDQDALRFIYRGDPTKAFSPEMLKEPLKTFVMTSLIFGANCSPFIAQYVKNKNADRFESTMPAAVKAIHTQHYMDDYVDSVPDDQTAVQLARDIMYIHLQGGFELCGWNSNSKILLDSVPTQSLGNTAVRFKSGQQTDGDRTLGLLWHTEDDTLRFDVSFKKIPENILNGEKKVPTKREMLRVVMTIFDVYGFLSPVTLNGKLILQETWQLKISWDDPVSDDIFTKWLKWIELLKTLHDVKFPRYYLAASMPTSFTTPESTSYKDLQLHVFCDASSQAFCAVAYWRWIDDDSNVYVAFIASKCRVAGNKATTIPRLELQAAVLATRLADSITKEHRMSAERRVFWSDSTTVLHWIRNDARDYNTYVANRLGEIDELTHASEWRYVPTKLNVADIATRENYDISALQGEWFNGPTFLHKDVDEWPLDVVNLENENNKLEIITVIQTEENLPVPEPTRFSSWLRLVRSTVRVLTFIDSLMMILKDKYKDRGYTYRTDDDDIMERAECLLLRYSQNQSFSREISSLQACKTIPTTSKILNLSPYLDEHGVLRAAGRIDAATDVLPEMKRPIILDGQNYVARLIVRHYHIKAAHGNQEMVVNELKQKFHIIRVRPTVKNVVKKCMLCRMRKCKPEIPRIGDLPYARMAHNHRPFSFCGLDLFGPMEVTVGRRHERRYGVLFTCLTVRAVHIETVPTLSTDSLIMALRRMSARRGWPRHLFSDNGTNLRGADTELKKSILDMDKKALTDEASNYGTKWTFIPPVSPHWGGAWERLIRSVKTSLHVILKERAPREETLSTLLAEVENIVNSRPLTHVSVEPGSMETLTPNHFLIGSSSNMPQIGAFDNSDLFLRKQWRISQRLADMFWSRWLKEVLPDLLPRNKWNQEQKPLQVGDLVLIVETNGPRNIWPKGLIEEVCPGRDGRVRVVKIRTVSGVLTRSANRVARIPLSRECC